MANRFQTLNIGAATVELAEYEAEQEKAKESVVEPELVTDDGKLLLGGGNNG